MVTCVGSSAMWGSRAGVRGDPCSVAVSIIANRSRKDWLEMKKQCRLVR